MKLCFSKLFKVQKLSLLDIGHLNYDSEFLTLWPGVAFWIPGGVEVIQCILFTNEIEFCREGFPGPISVETRSLRDGLYVKINTVLTVTVHVPFEVRILQASSVGQTPVEFDSLQSTSTTSERFFILNRQNKKNHIKIFKNFVLITTLSGETRQFILFE